LLLTSWWRSPASSSSRVQEAPLGCPSSPPWRPQVSPRCSSAPPRRVRPPPLTARRRTSLRQPRAPAPLPPPRPVATGVRDSTSQGRPAPHHSPLPPPPPTSSQESPEGRVLAARAADTPHFLVPNAPAVGFPSPSYAPPAPAPAATRRGWPHWPGASVGLNARHPQSPFANGTR
jgi:hypothetical protein